MKQEVTNIFKTTTVNITPFEAGKLAKHVYFKAATLYIIQVLANGKIACRYQSFTKSKDGNSEFILHYAEFEQSELEPYEPTQESPSFSFI